MHKTTIKSSCNIELARLKKKEERVPGLVLLWRLFAPLEDLLVLKTLEDEWYETAAFHTEQCTTPSLSHNIEVSQGARRHSLKSYG